MIFATLDIVLPNPDEWGHSYLEGHNGQQYRHHHECHVHTLLPASYYFSFVFKGKPLMMIKMTLRDGRNLIVLHVSKNLYSFNNLWAITVLPLICAIWFLPPSISFYQIPPSGVIPIEKAMATSSIAATISDLCVLFCQLLTISLLFSKVGCLWGIKWCWGKRGSWSYCILRKTYTPLATCGSLWSCLRFVLYDFCYPRYRLAKSRRVGPF